MFHVTLASGGNGGIMASAHIRPEVFVRTARLFQEDRCREALAEWNKVSRLIPLLFREPNPCPVKYLLARKGLIRSDETRLPLTPISDGLKKTLDALLSEGAV